MPRVHPTRDDPLVGTMSEVVGGPLGARAGRHRWWTPVRVLLALTTVCLALGMLSNTACVGSQWQDSDQRYRHMCYSDLPYLYDGRGFSEQAWPYSDRDLQDEADPGSNLGPQPMEYPVGISYWAWGASHVTHWLSGSPAPDDPDRDLASERVTFVGVNAVGFALVALLTTWLLAGVHRGRPWDAAGFALAPALVATGLINWDLLALVFVAGALWAWARGRPVLTGVMIGLGTATKLYPLFLLGGILVICLRQRRTTRFLVTAGAAAGAWLLANLPALVTGAERWKVFWSFNSDRPADFGSVWLVAQQAMGTGIAVETVNQVSWLFLIGWCLGVLVLGLRAPATPRLAQLGLLVVAGFLLVNKVYSPQYVLWLLPLAVLARPRWRDLLLWQAGELVYFAAIWWYLGGRLEAGGGGEAVFYWIAIGVRVLAQLYLVAVVVRDVLWPRHDPVPRGVS